MHKMELNVLHCLHENKHVSCERITEILSIDKSSVSKAMLTLEKEGYILNGVITDKGKKYLTSRNLKVALVIAGGLGTRTGQSVPKQFLTIKEIPIIIYSLLNVKKSLVYDKIVVVIPEGWQAFMISYCTKYDIAVDEFIIGGDTRLDSILNAVRLLDEKYNDNDIVSIIDANRPLIPFSVFEENIRMVQASSSQTVILSTTQCVDSMFQKTSKGLNTLERENCLIGQTPETARLKVFKYLYYNAKKDKVKDLALSYLAIKYHYPVETVAGSVKSFKITVKDDLDIFRALLD